MSGLGLVVCLFIGLGTTTACMYIRYCTVRTLGRDDDSAAEVGSHRAPVRFPLSGAELVCRRSAINSLLEANHTNG